MSRQLVLEALLNLLWDEYLGRVEYARTYKEQVEARGGRVVNDHIAFRTFNAFTGGQQAGIGAIARIFLPLGYVQKDKYTFPSKHLTAWHYEHANPLMPKLFISQLELSTLPEAVAKNIRDVIGKGQQLFTPSAQRALAHVQMNKELSKKESEELAADLHKTFARPWAPPRRDAIEEINIISQYAAWTLLHGNSVNHFTAYINEQQVSEWPDIEATVAGLRAAGVPMKAEVEGEPGSKLRQSSTEAVHIPCEVTEADGSKGHIDWTYAYYELAERNPITDIKGQTKLFTGFLGEQATHLFDMTKKG